jgi:lysophospholipase L1-like esterase
MKIIVIILALVGAACVGAALEKLESRASLVCAGVPCRHLGARIAAIESVIDQNKSEPVYLAIGDSLTERADLPPICGRRAINAGIGWAGAETFETRGRALAERARPSFIVIMLGTNDVDGDKKEFRRRMTKLLDSLKPWQTMLLPIPPISGNENVKEFNAVIAELQPVKIAPLEILDTIDGVHFTAAGYVEWKTKMLGQISEAICPL